MNFGYGYRWSEPKESGLARTAQLLREPGSGLAASLVVCIALVIYVAAMTGAYAVVHALDAPGVVTVSDAPAQTAVR